MKPGTKPGMKPGMESSFCRLIPTTQQFRRPCGSRGALVDVVNTALASGLVAVAGWGVGRPRWLGTGACHEASGLGQLQRLTGSRGGFWWPPPALITRPSGWVGGGGLGWSSSPTRNQRASRGGGSGRAVVVDGAAGWVVKGVGRRRGNGAGACHEASPLRGCAALGLRRAAFGLQVVPVCRPRRRHRPAPVPGRQSGS